MTIEQLKALQNGSDVRGIAMTGVPGEDVNLTNEAAMKISGAFSLWLSKKTGKEVSQLTIAIGSDTRLTGHELGKAAAKGIAFNGAKYIRCGLATTPSMFMSTIFDETKYDGSIMITASHLPFNRNGLKFFCKDGGLDHDDITEILNLAFDQDETQIAKVKLNSAHKYDLIDKYSEYLRGIICKELNSTEAEKPLKGLHIVVDSGNGASGFFVDKILQPLGADTSGSQFLNPDGLFPNHIPNPENKEAMKAIQNATVSNHADLGLIFDTDVDRMSAVFSDGTEVNRDSIIALISAILAESYPGSTIVTDSVASDRLTYFLEEVLHLHHFRYMRGYKNVIKKQKELNAAGTVCPLAMETSGHGALMENFYLDDGAYLAVKLIIALAKARKTGKKLESYIEKLPPLVEDMEVRFKILEKDFSAYGLKVLEQFKLRAEEKKYILPESYEGIRISFKNEDVKGWILLRKSLHDPVMPLNIEGERPGDMEKLKKIAASLLEGFDGLDMSNF